MAKRATKAKSLFKPAKSAAKKSSLATVEGGQHTEAIDQFKALNQEIKALKGKQDILKADLMEFANRTHSEMLEAGKTGNFKLLGYDAEITYIAQNSSSSLTEDDIEDVRSEVGDIVDDLVEVDFGSVKLNSELFAEHADKISQLLIKGLGEDVASELFSAPNFKVKDDVLAQIAESGNDSETIEALVSGLKIKRYIKA